jgi:hypothetical protein
LLYNKDKFFSIRQIEIRTYTTLSNSSTDSSIIFFDADKDKLNILNFVKNKTGIYMWINKLNSKKYIGSSINLRCRLLEYQKLQ